MAQHQTLARNLSDAGHPISSIDRVRTVHKPLRKRAVLVLGMHRSGTSALTRMLSLLGADLPSGLLPAKAGDNTPGYWESQELVSLHDEILASAGSSWDDVSPLPESWFRSELQQHYLDEATKLLERDFENSSLFVLKDPRFSRLVPFWRDALARFDADPAFILSIRNPLEVAASLKNRGAMPLAKSVLCWLGYVLEAERRTRDCTRSIVAYEDLLGNWEGVAQRLGEDLDLAWPRYSHRAKIEIEAFLSDRHRHHLATTDELEARDDVIPWVKEAYSLLMALPRSSDRALTDRLDHIWSELRAADLAFGPVVADAELSLAYTRSKLERLERESSNRQQEAGRLAEEVSQRDGRIDDLQRHLLSHRQEVERLAAKVSQRDGRIGELQNEISVRQREVDRLASELSQRDGRIDELGRKLDSRNRQLEQRSAQSIARAEELERLQATLSAHHLEIQRLGDSLSARDERLTARKLEIRQLSEQLSSHQEILSMREHEKRELSAELEARTAEVAHLRVLVNEHNRQMAAAQQENQRFRERLDISRSRILTFEESLGYAQAELEYLTHSKSWRLTAPLRWLLLKLKRSR